MYPIPPGEHLVENRNCKKCGSIFPITDKDMEFYAKVSPVIRDKKYHIPPPKLCPDCRQQRRLAFRNERKLYKRKCDETGKEIISIYSLDKPYTVYHQDYWWSDAWDPMKYGREFDFSRSAMEQMGDLMKEVPKLALSVEKQENSDYTNYAGWNKDCYLIFLGANNENCHYCSGVWDSKNTLDCNNSSGINDSYALVDCIDCQSCISLENSHNCYKCQNSINLENCRNCLFSMNVKNQEFFILNKKVSKDLFERTVVDKKLLEQLALEFEKLRQNHPRKENTNLHSEKVTGNYIQHGNNIHTSFDITDSENCKYSTWLFHAKNCYDVYDWGNTAENCYECHKVGDSVYSTSFSVFCLTNIRNLLYCYDCVNNTEYCFLCTGLRNKSYCILNRQYTKEEYEELVPRIIEKMMADGEWGEFFPASLSLFGYNETVAQEYFPLSREEVLGNTSLTGEDVRRTGGVISHTNPPVSPLSGGSSNKNFLHGPIFNWSDYEAPFPQVEKIIPASKIPDSIDSIPDDILNWAIECEVSLKPFRIIKQELEFYRKHNLPIPRRHPDIRQMDRMKQRNPRKLFERLCDSLHCEENWKKKGVILKEGENAGYPDLQKNPPVSSVDIPPSKGGLRKTMITTYSLERPERVYCEECYLREVMG